MALSPSKKVIILGLCAVMVLPGCLRRTVALGAAAVSTATGAATSAVSAATGAATSLVTGAATGGGGVSSGGLAAGGAGTIGAAASAPGAFFNPTSAAARSAAVNTAAAAPIPVSSPTAALNDVMRRCLVDMVGANAITRGYSYVIDTSIQASAAVPGTVQAAAPVSPGADEGGFSPAALSGLTFPGAGCEITSGQIAQSLAFTSTLAQIQQEYPDGIVLGGPNGEVGPCNGFTFDIDGARKAWLRFTAELDLTSERVQGLNSTLGVDGTAADCDPSRTNMIIELLPTGETA